MQSPFEIFRKHQKMLTVVLTGLAMFAFVVLGAVPDPAAMSQSPALTAIFLAGVVGGLAWVAGIRKKKSNEWGLIGVIAGLILGIVAAFAVQPGVVVRADTGNINNQQMQFLHNQRSLANQFVYFLSQRARENGAQIFQEPYLFRFGHPEESKDVVVGELLRREADRLGMETTDETVNDFILRETQGKVGSADIRDFRNQRGVSETTLYQSLKAELKARKMAEFLYGRNILPPVTYWDFYREMNVQQSVGIVPIPVDAFIDLSAEPTEADLQKLFEDHKANFPNSTIEGRLVEGVPGFHQPRRVALEYVEIPFESVEKSIGEITDAEVEAHYEEFYKAGPVLNPPADDDATSQDDAPMLPELQSDDAPATEEKPVEEDEPTEDKPAPTEGDAPAEDKPAEPASPVEPPTETTPDEPAAEDSPADAPPAEEATDDAADSSENESGTSLEPPVSVQQVAFFDDEVPAEVVEEPATDDAAASEAAPTEEPAADDEPAAEPAPPAEEKPAGEEPADESTPAETPDSPPAETTDETPEAPDEPPTDEAPESPATSPAEPSTPRVLDDDLRAEIREQILRRKTAERQQQLMAETFEMMSELSFGATAPEDDSSHVSPQKTTDDLKAYAEENGLIYERTPLLSQRELSRSEEYPIGKASSATNFQSPSTVTQMAFNSAPTDQYRPEQVLDIESGSRFVFWKVEDVPAYVPESLDGPGIRDQVVATWRQLQAREKAKARAEELAKQAQGVEKPLSEIFAEATVTGVEDAQSLTVVHPPRFSWLSAANAQMSPNPFNRPAPTLTELRTVPGDVGEQFMETVFNELQPGETGVAHSYDLEYYYVVRVDERTYGTSTDVQAFRDRFTTQPVFDQFGFSDYSKLAFRKLGHYETNWANDLFERHKVNFSGLERQESDDVES